MQVKTPKGILRSTACRLFPVAPKIFSCLPLPLCRTFGIFIDLAPDRNLPVTEFELLQISLTDPSATIFPPCMPAPGPISTT